MVGFRKAELGYCLPGPTLGTDKAVKTAHILELEDVDPHRLSQR